jgi:hypothetical protein
LAPRRPPSRPWTRPSLGRRPRNHRPSTCLGSRISVKSPRSGYGARYSTPGFASVNRVELRSARGSMSTRPTLARRTGRCRSLNDCPPSLSKG